MIMIFPVRALQQILMKFQFDIYGFTYYDNADKYFLRPSRGL